VKLENLGWRPFFERAFEAVSPSGCVPARVIWRSRGVYRLAAEAGEFRAGLAGSLLAGLPRSGARPTCGDWLCARLLPAERLAIIEALLPRFSSVERRAPGSGFESQVVAANVDAVFVVAGLDADYNPGRIERYVVVVLESGSKPVVVLNKSDIPDDPGQYVDEVSRRLPGVPVLAVSAATGHGLHCLAPFLEPGHTAALVGSSGVGKSSILNRLANDALQPTAEVNRYSGRGRHTTTLRRLFATPSGGLLLDTPGMRELQLWTGQRGVNDAFGDIGSLAAQCRFRDCRHESEPGCRVRQAAERGDIPEARLRSYSKLRRESDYVELRQRLTPNRIERERWKRVAVDARAARRRSKSRQRLDE